MNICTVLTRSNPLSRETCEATHTFLGEELQASWKACGARKTLSVRLAPRGLEGAHASDKCEKVLEVVKGVVIT